MQDALWPYKTLPVWDAQSLPQGFRRAHHTQAGTWAQLTVLHGSVGFAFLDEAGNTTSTHVFDPQHQPPRIEPQAWHTITEVSDDVQCQLQFLCAPADYFSKKHDLMRTHSEVLLALDEYGLSPGHVLDAGCGNGRNTLFLAAHGFTVDAWDVNQERLDNLARIATLENLQDRIHTRCMDFNAMQLPRTEAGYDLVLCTVVLMFLQARAAWHLLEHMQDVTKPGGHNLVVAAMDSADYPRPDFFPFAFAPGELRQAYADWDILKSNEDVGELRHKDAQGNNIRLRFATLLARKR